MPVHRQRERAKGNRETLWSRHTSIGDAILTTRRVTAAGGRRPRHPCRQSIVSDHGLEGWFRRKHCRNWLPFRGIATPSRIASILTFDNVLLTYLRASSWVHAEHPRCTNWFGAGPGRGPVLPDTGSMIPIFWSDYLQALQRPSGMRARQEASRGIYLEVFHGHRPRCGDWAIDYRFATPSDADQSRGSSGRDGGPAPHGDW